ncbi:C3HC zinc finger-like-domain-containing protein [Favolaschia claudopus]|uniref:C3HC zinc finger-like-domain-containing protein n=1 Tax=Favolaschia claudopus TaxID=2862362 RepID=A0AAW0C1W9_9AGAR
MSMLSATTSATSAPIQAADAETLAARTTATKRKLADAFQSLDAAVDVSTNRPIKKANTGGRSFYATLAKYGVKPKQANPQYPSLSKNTPHLSAILARAASRTRKALPFASNTTPPPPLPPTAEYRPSSVPSFLARLATFKLATYANKPQQIDAVAAAKCGWTNDGKDRLVCGLCTVSWVLAGREGMTRDAANALVEKQRIQLVDAHKNGCPWKTRQCDPSIYRVPLQAPTVMVRDMKTNAAALDPFMQGMEVKHPLTANQLASLLNTVSAFTLPPPDDESTTSSPPNPSETAVLTSAFGWAPAPPNTTERARVPSLSRPSSRAASRANSPFPESTPPRISRSSTLATSTPTTEPIASTSKTAPAPPSTPPRQFLRRISSTISLGKREASTSLLHCALCQRRVGLWAFVPPTELASPPPPRPGAQIRPPLPQRQFDLLKEHRSFCPYVVKSTVVPSLPTEIPGTASATAGVGATPGILEGWRAVLTVVLRYGLGQRQRERRLRGSVDDIATMDVDGNSIADQPAVVDNVGAMVESVKARGGKELLRYVKGLLG